MSGVVVRSERLDIISICTGGGGLDLGVELAIPGARSVVLVEREAFAAAQLVSAMEAGLMAPAPLWSDARTFNGRAWRGCVDGLIGGIPCQPHSLAGKRLGREDPRDLWSTARRIIVQSGAWFVLIENVEGMLSSGGAERVHRDLGRLGFAREVGLFTAAEVGASHQRLRTFILGVADAICERGCSWSAGGEDAADAHSAGQGMADRYSQHGDWSGVEREGRWRQSSDRSGSMVDAPGLGWGEGRAEPELRGRWDATAGSDGAMADANVIELRGQSPAGEQPQLQRDDAIGLFPPGPTDLDGWRRTLDRAPELEPAVRKLAHGMANLVDNHRVDQLRLLGNGVVPLQAAHALRTLSHRLAQRGSTGAARLVRLMEAA